MNYLEHANEVKRILTVKNEEGGKAGGGIVIYGGYYTHHLNEDIYVQKGRLIAQKIFSFNRLN